MGYLKKNILKCKKTGNRNEIIFESEIEGKIGISYASIRESEPHYHNKTTEWYLVEEGSAIAYLNGKEEKLEKHYILQINPGTIHWVKDDIKLWVISYPAWKKEDHHKVVK